MIEDGELELKLGKLENTAAIWAGEYIRARQQSDPIHRNKARTGSSVHILSLERINTKAKALNIPVFPTGVTGEGRPSGLSDVTVTQALVLDIFVYRLMVFAKDNKYWPRKFIDDVKAVFVRRPAGLSHQTQQHGFQPTQRLRKVLVTDITDFLLDILESPKEKKYQSLRKKLMKLGYRVLDICVDMARADLRYHFASFGDVRSYDTRLFEEYFGSVCDEANEELKRDVYLLVFPPCMRSKLDTDYIDDTSDVVVKKGRALLRECGGLVD